MGKPKDAVHWYVTHEDGTPSLATGSYQRNRAIKYWLDQAGETWPFWYRRGFRVRRVRVSWKLEGARGR